MINEGQLIEWKHLSDMATEGPWNCTEIIAGVDSFVVHQCVGDKFGAKGIASNVSSEDAEFMIAAREVMPLLIDRVSELETSNKRKTKKLNELVVMIDWLVCQCETLSCYNPIMRQGMSREQWRSAAREVVSGERTDI